MFGLKFNPKNILPMLSTFGIDINTLTPEIMQAILDWYKREQEAAGTPLVTIFELSEDKTFFLCAMYKKIEGKLEFHKSYDLKNITELVKNIIDAAGK